MNSRHVMSRHTSENLNTLKLIFLPLLAALLILAAGACRTPSGEVGKSDVAKADGRESRSTQSYRSERKVDIEKPKWEEGLEDVTTGTEEKPVAVEEVEEEIPVQPADPVESDLEAIAKNSRELDPPVVKPPMTTQPEIGKRCVACVRGNSIVPEAGITLIHPVACQKTFSFRVHGGGDI